MKDRTMTWVDPYVQSDRHDDGNGCALGIDELGCQEQDERIRPWVFGDSSAEECLQDCHVVGKVCISHPCNAVNGYECDDACAEDLAVAYFWFFVWQTKRMIKETKSMTIWMTVVMEMAFILPLASAKCGSRSGKLPRILRCRGCRRGK